MNLKNCFLLVLLTTVLLVKASEAVCGGQIQGPNGSFSTPGFPQNYPNNVLCVWRLNLARGSTLNITFMEFHTELCCDILEIRNGSSSRFLSGELTPFYVATTAFDNNTVIIIDFLSDSSVNEKGFIAYYTITRPPPLIPTPTSTPATPAPTQPPILGCGGVLNDSSGSFMSPGYPGYYSNSLNCIWTLRIPADGYLRLKFIVFHTELCCDFVELLDSAGQRIEVLRGYKPLYTVRVDGNTTDVVKIRFDSDSSVRKKGFLAQYHIITFQRKTSTTTVLITNEATVIPTLSSTPSGTTLSTALVANTPATAVPNFSSTPINTAVFTVESSASSITPVMSSSISPPAILPPDVQRVLVDLMKSLGQIMQKVTGLLGQQITPAKFQQFRNETLQILLQIENQLLVPTPTQPSNMQVVKRAIPEMANLQDVVQMLENIQRRLLG